MSGRSAAIRSSTNFLERLKRAVKIIINGLEEFVERELYYFIDEINSLLEEKERLEEKIGEIFPNPSKINYVTLEVREYSGKRGKTSYYYVRVFYLSGKKAKVFRNRENAERLKKKIERFLEIRDRLSDIEFELEERFSLILNLAEQIKEG